MLSTTGNAVASSEALEQGLVHGNGRRANPGTHVGDPGDLAKALHRAVFTERAVEGGEHDVDEA